MTKTNKNSTRRKSSSKINFTLNENYLNYFIAYSMFNSILITVNNLKKLQYFITNISLKDYDDDEILSRVSLLKYILKDKISGEDDIDLILDNYRSNGKYNEYVDDIVNNVLENFCDENGDFYLSENDILYTDRIITSAVKYSFIYNFGDRIDEIINRYKANDYDDLDELTEIYETLISKIHKKFQEVKELNSDALMDFNSNDDTCKIAINNVVNQVKSPASIINTSIRAKNTMLNGGYEAGRFYLILGLQGRGKSRELLQIAMDTKHFNKDLAGDSLIDGKKPVILFVTQENSVRETLQRIWSYYGLDKGEENIDFKKLGTEFIYNELCKKGFNKGPELLIRYRKSKSITTADIDAMIDDIEQNGNKKVIIVLHDYLKRIKSVENIGNDSDTYTELGNISDEFSNIAKVRNIVVVSAMQFNRTAMNKVLDGDKRNKNELLKTVSSADISESIKVVDNSDVIYSILDIKDSATGETLQSYNLLKFRGKYNSKSLSYFTHPFDDGNTIKLKPDVNLSHSLSKLQINDEVDKLNISKERIKSSSMNSGGRQKRDNPALKEIIEDEG